MTPENMGCSQRNRIILISLCMLIFASIITLSLMRINYVISGVNDNELTVTRLSLTHSIERNNDGTFERADEEGVACPT